MFERWIDDLDPLITIFSGFLVFAFIIYLVLSMLAIWSVNTLFDINITFTLENIFAAMVLLVIIGRDKNTLKNN